MQRNVSNQKWIVFSFDSTTNQPKLGDAANITANLSKDGAAGNATNDTNPTELEDGYYVFSMLQAESNADILALFPASSTSDIIVIATPATIYTRPPNFPAMGIESDGDLTQVNQCIANTDMRGTDSAALDSTVAKAATLAAMETTLQTEHGLLESGISNIGSGISRIQTSLVDQVLVPSGNNWVKVVVLVNDSIGTLFDPADIVDPSGSPVYNGVGAKFTDIDDDQVIMYKDNVGTPLDQVTLCAHAPQSNKPQILERDAHGRYYYWMNATATGNALPVGQLKTLFGLFDITQAEATYSGSSPFLIQDTDPSSHLHILFSITVSAETGTNERLDDIIEDIAEHETARATMQSRAEGTGYDPAQNSLKNIKDTIG